MDFECVLSFECLSFVEPSFGESEVSDDYAIPPDAFASETSSLDIALSSGCRLTSGVNNHIVVHGSSGAATGAVLTVPLGPSSSTSTNPSGGPITNSLESSPRKESLEKAGYLTKLGGKLKTWRKRYFALKNGTLTYWKSQVSPFPRNASPVLVLLSHQEMHGCLWSFYDHSCVCTPFIFCTYYDQTFSGDWGVLE
jgi:hypothetical protein